MFMLDFSFGDEPECECMDYKGENIGEGSPGVETIEKVLDRIYETLNDNQPNKPSHPNIYEIT